MNGERYTHTDKPTGSGQNKHTPNAERTRPVVVMRAMLRSTLAHVDWSVWWGWKNKCQLEKESERVCVCGEETLYNGLIGGWLMCFVRSLWCLLFNSQVERSGSSRFLSHHARRVLHLQLEGRKKTAAIRVAEIRVEEWEESPCHLFFFPFVLWLSHTQTVTHTHTVALTRDKRNKRRPSQSIVEPSPVC